MPIEEKQPKPVAAVRGATEISASREKELLDRIRRLEEMNSALQDKLDMIWSILEPDYELPADDGMDDSGEDGLVQIQGIK